VGFASATCMKVTFKRFIKPNNQEVFGIQ